MDRGALVACGSAGRGLSPARISRGWPFCSAAEAINPTPEGVGVKGGGLLGDSESDAGLRLFGKGVVGRDGIAKGRSGEAMMVPFASSCVDWDGGVVDGVALRFFGAGVGLVIFSYFAVVGFGAFASALGVVVALVFATRDERRRDMLEWVDGVVLVNGVI